MWKLQLAVCVLFLHLPVSVSASPKLDTGEVAHEDEVEVPVEMRWEPRWRRPGDCGRSAAYVVLKLLGSDIEFERVASAVSIDPVAGCTMQSLQHAMESLGVTARVRFIDPEELSNVPRPFILHSADSLNESAGHFTVVAAFKASNRQYGIVDTSDEGFKWIPEASLQRQLSGYVLVLDGNREPN